jgi:tetratricopeptide (TPR) repeat protein
MNHAARSLRTHGHRAASIAIANRAVQWSRDDPDLLELRSAALYLAERWDESLEAWQQHDADFKNTLKYRAYLGILAARVGDRDRALEVAEELRTLDEPYLRGSHTWSRAIIAAHLGDKDRAVELLRQSLSEGKDSAHLYHCMQVGKDVHLEPLWGYPPFEELREPKG